MATTHYPKSYVPYTLYVISLDIFLMARHVLRLWYMCLAIRSHIGGSILATTHYQKSYVNVGGARRSHYLRVCVCLFWS